MGKFNIRFGVGFWFRLVRALRGAFDEIAEALSEDSEGGRTITRGELGEIVAVVLAEAAPVVEDHFADALGVEA